MPPAQVQPATTRPFIAGLQWLITLALLGVLTGSACALFLWSLDAVTHYRIEHPAILWGLPIVGLWIAWLSQRVGPEVNSGNNLIIHEIRQPNHGVPLRMAPFVFMGTLLTHLCGGSAGREGTAVQMGGSLAGGLSLLFPNGTQSQRRWLLMAGVAAGFGGVFGTPWAGVIFALEVARRGTFEGRSIPPCLIAAWISDWTCHAWGIGHTKYSVASLIPEGSLLEMSPLRTSLLTAGVLAGVLFGLTARLFTALTHGVRDVLDRPFIHPLVRPVLGSAVILGLVTWLGTRDYLGLSVSSETPNAATLVNAFHMDGVQPWSWWWKLLFTAITLGSGFKGGEATPLFFIGAALGNSLAQPTGLPVDFLAALGFVSVFAGATHTPLACTVMASELFGIESMLYYGLSCFVAHFVSGPGVYSAQHSTQSPSPVTRPLGLDQTTDQTR